MRFASCHAMDLLHLESKENEPCFYTLIYYDYYSAICSFVRSFIFLVSKFIRCFCLVISVQTYSIWKILGFSRIRFIPDRRQSCAIPPEPHRPPWRPPQSTRRCSEFHPRHWNFRPRQFVRPSPRQSLPRARSGPIPK